MSTLQPTNQDDAYKIAPNASSPEGNTDQHQHPSTNQDDQFTSGEPKIHCCASIFFCLFPERATAKDIHQDEAGKGECKCKVPCGLTDRDSNQKCEKLVYSNDLSKAFLGVQNAFWWVTCLHVIAWLAAFAFVGVLSMLTNFALAVIAYHVHLTMKKARMWFFFVVFIAGLVVDFMLIFGKTNGNIQLLATISMLVFDVISAIICFRAFRAYRRALNPDEVLMEDKAWRETKELVKKGSKRMENEIAQQEDDEQRKRLELLKDSSETAKRELEKLDSAKAKRDLENQKISDEVKEQAKEAGGVVIGVAAEGVKAVANTQTAKDLTKAAGDAVKKGGEVVLKSAQEQLEKQGEALLQGAKSTIQSKLSEGTA